MHQFPFAFALLLCLTPPLMAQDKGSIDPPPLPPLEHPDSPATPAKELFGRKSGPAHLEARAIGFYAHGCLAGAQALPVEGEAWQVMRLSRNRNWGHPALIAFLERFARKIPKVNGWPGILVGDISQPRGGPMLTGHASHQSHVFSPFVQSEAQRAPDSMASSDSSIASTGTYPAAMTSALLLRRACTNGSCC